MGSQNMGEGPLKVCVSVDAVKEKELEVEQVTGRIDLDPEDAILEFDEGKDEDWICFSRGD